MTRIEAEKELRKRFGKQGMYRVSTTSSPEARETATAAWRAAKAERLALEVEIAARLEALDWLRELRAKKQELSRKESAALAKSHHYKFTVGRDLTWAFHVDGHGDTWEEAFRDADQKGKP